MDKKLVEIDEPPLTVKQTQPRAHRHDKEKNRPGTDKLAQGMPLPRNQAKDANDNNNMEYADDPLG